MAEDNSEQPIGELGYLDSDPEVQPYQRGAYWVALELLDKNNLQWVAEGNAVVAEGDKAYYEKVGSNISGVNNESTYVTCKLIISDAPAISLPSWTTDLGIGKASGTTFSAEYRTQGYKFGDLFYGYQSHSMQMEITSYIDSKGETPSRLPNSILNAGKYTISFKPAEKYSWAGGSTGCGCTVMADLSAGFTVIVNITQKVLDTPPAQNQFLSDGAKSGEFEYIPASDGTWKVSGYRKSGDESADFTPQTSFGTGTFDVEVKLTAPNNYAWRTPESGKDDCAITELVIWNTEDLGFDNPVLKDSVGNPVYDEKVTSVNTSTYIDYNTLLTHPDHRYVSQVSYDSYEGGTYSRKTENMDLNNTSTIREAGEYVITFTLPDPIGTNPYGWKQDASGNPLDSRDTTGVRTVKLTVEKAVIDFDSYTDSVTLKNGRATLSSSFINNALYTVTYSVEGGNGTLTSDGIPSAKGTYIATLTLNSSAYRNYRFGNTSKTAGEGAVSIPFQPKYG